MFVSMIHLSFVFLCICAAIFDYRRLIIPNWISLTLIALFAMHAVLAMQWSAIGAHVAIGLAVFALATASYAFGVFGGGDVKLLAATALWAGPPDIFPLLALTGLLGGVLGIVVLSSRNYIKHYPALADRAGEIWNVARWGHDGTCPYGIPIAVAAIVSVHSLFQV